MLRALLSSGISDTDKAMMCLNLAVVYEKMGRMNDALLAFADGVDYERRHGRFYVREQRAAFLAKHERFLESLTEYQALSGVGELTEADRERIRQNIAYLKGRVP